MRLDYRELRWNEESKHGCASYRVDPELLTDDFWTKIAETVPLALHDEIRDDGHGGLHVTFDADSHRRAVAIGSAIWRLLAKILTAE